MKRISIVCLVLGALVVISSALAKGLELKALPPEVQKTVQNEAKGAEIKNIGKEKEDGVVQYEVETILNGKHRDFNVDAKGVLLVVEEETTLESIPAAARAAIQKKVEVDPIVKTIFCPQ